MSKFASSESEWSSTYSPPRNGITDLLSKPDNAIERRTKLYDASSAMTSAVRVERAARIGSGLTTSNV